MSYLALAVYVGGFIPLWVLFRHACPYCYDASLWDVLALFVVAGWAFGGIVVASRITARVHRAQARPDGSPGSPGRVP